MELLLHALTNHGWKAAL
jgi:hypothetical protein